MPDIATLVFDWLSAHQQLLIGLGAASLLMVVGCALAAPWLLARLPVDHYTRAAVPSRSHWLLTAVRNLLGGLLLVAGLVMLALPGQGLLTMLVGLALMDFPGRRDMERRLLGLPALRKSVNWLRARGGAPPFELDEPRRAPD